MSDPRYPIGKFNVQASYTAEEIQACISRIESLPSRMEQATKALTPTQLDTPYRDGGWTRRQVVHHVADSHMNAYIRTKWTLTEDTPLIKAYLEKEWVKTPEMNADPALSLAILRALHARWTLLLRSLSPEQLKRAFIHPDTKQTVPIERIIAMYAWHGDHHLAHISG